MTVHVVAVERNTTSVNGEMFWILGVFADPVDARRARWAAIRELLNEGQVVYGRRTGGDWDVEVKVESHEVQ